jgi:hypothetical protein
VISLGQILVGISDGVCNLVSGSDESTPLTENIPAFLPQQIVQKRSRDMLPFIQAHRRRLEKARGTKAVDEIERQIEELKRTYKTNSILRDELDRFSVLTPFTESRKQVEGKFEGLVDFVGGLATVFPGTPTVESDFSIIGGEQDIYSSALTDLSLEGLLHARQFDALRRI